MADKLSKSFECFSSSCEEKKTFKIQ